MKNKRKVVEEWIRNNGAADFDLKKRDIILFDGGLFSIEKEKVMRHKILGQKKLPAKDGFGACYEVIFSKKKTEPCEEYKAVFWMSELDETIDYLKRMKKMLNSLGYDTGASHFKNLKKKKK